MDMPHTVIHIGLPRTASTFLQSAWFPHARGHIYLGPEVCQYAPHWQELLYQDDWLWNPEGFSQAHAGWLRAAGAPAGAPLLLSNELFCGQGLFLQATNRSRTARRLAQAFPDATIALVLREPVSLLRSLYTLAIYSGYHMLPEDFVHIPDSHSSEAKPLYPTFAPAERADTYLHAPLVALFQSLFTRVELFHFEDFRRDAQGFMAAFAERLHLHFATLPDAHTRPNRSLSATQVRMLRLLNRWKPLLETTRAGAALYRIKLRFVERYMGGGAPFAFPERLHEALAAYYTKQAETETPVKDQEGVEAA